MINAITHFQTGFRGLSAERNPKSIEKRTATVGVLQPLQQDTLTVSGVSKPLLNPSANHHSGYDFSAVLELRHFLTNFPEIINANKRLERFNPAVVEAWEAGLQGFKITSLTRRNEQALIEEGLLMKLMLDLPEKFTELMLRDPKSDNFSALAYPELTPYTLSVAYQPDPVKEGRYLLMGQFPIPQEAETALQNESHFERMFKGQFHQAVNQQFDAIIKESVLRDFTAQIRYDSIRHDMKHQFITTG
jgi:hypothetical protein